MAAMTVVVLAALSPSATGAAPDREAAARDYGGGSQGRHYPDRPPPRPPLGRVIHVPADAPTVQAGVDAARPGDMVLVARGVYHEAVRVTTAGITIRGENRPGVILDGDLKEANKSGIAVIGADGVAIENLTARHYQLNGFYWRSVYGFRGSFLTAYNNGDYGLYAFDSGFGMFDHDYASGHPDSGFYIGQCNPCHALITNVVSKGNGLGYSGTNAGGDMIIRDSEWAENMAGIVPNTLDSEALPPQRSVAIVGNWVHGNHNRLAPANSTTFSAFGNGIVLAGGSDNEVAYNLVDDHPYAGIAVSSNIDTRIWVASGNRIHDNAVGGSGVADLALAGPTGKGNCFTGNRFRSSIPPAIEETYGCESPIAGIGGGDLGLAGFAIGYALRAARDFRHGDWRTRPTPPMLAGMPDATVAPATPGLYSPLDQAGEVAGDRAGADAGSIGPAAPAMAAFPGAGRPGRSGVLGNLFFVVLGYGLPLLFILAVASRLLGRQSPEPRGGLARTRILVVLPIAFVALTLVAVALGYAGVGS
jgi:Right handed beta helix region